MKIIRSTTALFVSAAILALSCSSCKNDDQNTCVGGSGGSLTIVAKIAHHGTVIPNDSLQPDTIWVKYNTQEWSNAPSGYNLRVIGEAHEDHVHLPNLKCGKYYLYGSGYDTSIQQVVKGGIPISTDQSTGELLTTIPVTE